MKAPQKIESPPVTAGDGCRNPVDGVAQYVWTTVGSAICCQNQECSCRCEGRGWSIGSGRSLGSKDALMERWPAGGRQLICQEMSSSAVTLLRGESPRRPRQLRRCAGRFFGVRRPYICRQSSVAIAGHQSSSVTMNAIPPDARRRVAGCSRSTKQADTGVDCDREPWLNSHRY